MQAARTERRSHKRTAGKGDPAVLLAQAWAERANARLRAIDPHARIEVKRMRRKASVSAIEIVVRYAFEHRVKASRALAGR